MNNCIVIFVISIFLLGCVGSSKEDIYIRSKKELRENIHALEDAELFLKKHYKNRNTDYNVDSLKVWRFQKYKTMSRILDSIYIQDNNLISILKKWNFNTLEYHPIDDKIIYTMKDSYIDPHNLYNITIMKNNVKNKYCHYLDNEYCILVIEHW